MFSNLFVYCLYRSSKLKGTTVENKERTEVLITRYIYLIVTNLLSTYYNTVSFQFQRDFFGQPVKSETRCDSIKETRTGSSTSIWFRFNEGFSDAVKKTIRIQDLL